jgi:hypothetical protein
MTQHLRLFVSIEWSITTGELRRDTFLKEVQLGLWNCKQSRATAETNRQLWEYQDAGLIQSFQAREMDIQLRAELCLLSAPTRYARHRHFVSPPDPRLVFAIRLRKVFIYVCNPD